MNGKVNSQNVRQYAPKGHPPVFNFDKSSNRDKLIFMKDGRAYLRMLNYFVFPELFNHFNNQYWEGMFRGVWWAQDGAPAHRLLEVRDRLNETFGENRVVGLGHNVEWPPRSPDLTPCDFYVGLFQG